MRSVLNLEQKTDVMTTCTLLYTSQQPVVERQVRSCAYANTPRRESQHGNETSVSRSIAAPNMKTSPHALQKDGISPAAVLGEIHLGLPRTDKRLTLDALVIEDVDVDVLAGTPFVIAKDISYCPVKEEVLM